MESDKDKDITRLMAEALRRQKLPYKEGAWERFKEMEAERKGKRALWPYFSAVAAAALLVFGVLITNNQQEIATQGDIVHTGIAIPDAGKVNTSKGQNIGIPNDKDADVRKSQNGEVSRRIAYNAPSQASSFTLSDKAGELQSEGLESEEAKNRQYSAIQSADPQSSETPSSTTPYSAAKPAERNAINENAISYDAMVQQEPDPLLNDGNDSRWSFSLELSPNIKNKEVNMGGGVGVSFALTDRLSISSGVSYVALDAQRGPSQQDIPQEFASTSLSKYNYNKSLSTINTSLVGLDIPLNVRFQVNPNMYASAGVSVFNVLDESRYNQFEEHVAVLGFTGTKDNSGNPEPVMQTLRTQELSEETPYLGKNFTGFFNLSIGYQLPVLKKLNLAVEPYIKVPIGSLSEQDMDLSNGGLKIITRF